MSFGRGPSKKKKDLKDKDTEPDEKGDLIAKKDWVLFQNEYHRVIKQGDDCSDVPEQLKSALRTEGVIE